MFSNRPWGILLIVMLLFASSCKEEEDLCDKCNSAIQHMCEKIEENGCNPEFMENALERLRNDCGFVSGSNFAGYMAHTCSNESALDCGTCIEIDGAISSGHLSLTQVPFELYTNVNNPDVLSIHVFTAAGQINSAQRFVFEMDQGEFNAFTEPDPLFGGDKIYVEVYDFTEQDLLVEADAFISMARSGNWIDIREIHVRYSFDTDEYVVDFQYW